MSQYLDLFLQEADEQLEILEAEILKLEDDPSLERMNVVFRAAHTLKGSSRAMGFASMANLTHEMENVLDLLRANKLVINGDITDALLACLDMLRQCREGIAANQGDETDSSSLVLRLQALSSGTSEAPTPLAPLSEGLSEDLLQALRMTADQQTVWHAKLNLAPDCAMKFVRVFMVINLVESGGELLATVPDREKLEDEDFESCFEIYFTHAKSLEELQMELTGVGEIASCEIGPWHEPATVSAPAVVLSKEVEPFDEAQRPEVGATASAKKNDANQTVRVDVARLDSLMNLVGELVIDRTRMAQIGTALSAQYRHDPNIEALSETVGHINRITSDLQEQIMKARMLPIETVFNRLPRVVRDLAGKVGKQVKLELRGGETELDRSVIENLSDPLLHILRNSLDHGLETSEDRLTSGKPEVGVITVTARHQENHIVIEIQDDGRGIDTERVKQKAVEKGHLTKEAADRLSEKEALNLIFASGLSTAKVVSDISGRGVGMDIVRSNIQKLGGMVDLETQLGTGTKFTLRLPLTLAIIHGLLVRVMGASYVLPLSSVIETLSLEDGVVQTVLNKEAVVIRGQTIPLLRVRQAFHNPYSNDPQSPDSYVVIVGLAEQRVGFVVDELIGEQEVVIKSLSGYCGEVHGISGATILGDGSVAMIADITSLISTAREVAA